MWLGGRELDPSIDENWWWLRKELPGTLALEPSISTGTVSVTNAQTGIVFSSAPVPSLVGWLFRVPNTASTYRITDHVAGQPNADLDTIYTNPTEAAAAYKAVRTDYPLATDVLRVIAPMRTGAQNLNYGPWKIHGTNVDRMEEDWPTAILHMGVPEQFAPVHQAATGLYTVRFNRYGFDTPGSYLRIEYDYVMRPALLTDFTALGTEEPVIPWEWRKIIADAATFNLLTLKNDDMAQTYLAQAQSGLQDMAKENRFKRMGMSNETGQIMPRDFWRYNRVLRTETGLIIG